MPNAAKFLGELALVAMSLIVGLFVSVYGGVILVGLLLALTFPRLRLLTLAATLAVLATLAYVQLGEPLRAHPERIRELFSVLGVGATILWLLEKI